MTKSDSHDWKKLKRVLGYIKSTLGLKLRLHCGDGVPVIKWWIDALYAVHHDMKSQTGAVMSLGSGSVFSKSTKQKINTKSSTESELIAASDMSGQVMWTVYFLKSQGYDIQRNIVYQDNQSAILLEKNRQLSSSQRTRHINICYFFIRDRVENNDMEIVYCPTEEMLGDFFTKPLQGKKFLKFRKLIMGCRDDAIQEGIGDDRGRDPGGNDTHLQKDSEF